MRRIAFLMLALAVAGCQSQEERLTAMNSQDDALCRKSVSAGSAAAYDQCRANLMQYRVLEEAEGRRRTQAAGQALTAAGQSLQNINRPTGFTCTTFGRTTTCN